MHDLPIGPRVRFRELRADDGYTVARWRNSASAHKAFFTNALVTPDSHAEFVRQRRPDDLLWMIENQYGNPVAMASLTIDRNDRSGEYGRAFLDEKYRGRGYWIEIECLILDFAFHILGLNRVWYELFGDNDEMYGLHKKFAWTLTGQRTHGGTGRPIVIMEYRPVAWAAKRDEAWGWVRERIVRDDAYTQ